MSASPREIGIIDRQSQTPPENFRVIFLIAFLAGSQPYFFCHSCANYRWWQTNVFYCICWNISGQSESYIKLEVESVDISLFECSLDNKVLTMKRFGRWLHHSYLRPQQQSWIRLNYQSGAPSIRAEYLHCQQHQWHLNKPLLDTWNLCIPSLAIQQWNSPIKRSINREPVIVLLTPEDLADRRCTRLDHALNPECVIN